MTRPGTTYRARYGYADTRDGDRYARRARLYRITTAADRGRSDDAPAWAHDDERYALAERRHA